MKAVVYTKLGPPEVLQLRELERPVPNNNEMLVKVHAASVNALDWRRFASQLENDKIPISTCIMDAMILKVVNKVLGADIAGQVVAVGSDVKQFRPGDEVFGISTGSMGAFAEYVCATENKLALKPANLSFQVAAAIPVAALAALEGLRDKGNIQPGQSILINGASGGVGMFAVQIAKSFGAEVTAVCSTRNLETASSIGADHVIDYKKEDFTRNGKQYDLIIAVNGYHPIRDYKRALSPGGVYCAIGGSIAQLLQGMFLGPFLSLFGGKRMSFMGIAKMSQKDLIFLGELAKVGKIAPVIDRCYPLSEAAKAVRYLAEGHAKGKVILDVERSS